MDGVLYRGDNPIKRSASAVAELRKRGKKLIFITNNSATSRLGYVRKLGRMGIPAKKSEIVTSGYATALHLRKNSPHARVFVVGGDGLKTELEEAGVRVLPPSLSEEATHLVVGLDKGLSYAKITKALQVLLKGADFIATNADPTYPTETGLSPGAGAVVGALVWCSGREPRVIVGKPFAPILEIALELIGAKPECTAIVGDRLDTDIEAGKKLGLRTVLVLSGVSTREEVRSAGRRGVLPDFVYESLGEAVFG
jgi:phosphoglycolate/pyridoxal phosphate phosphatase family enzyme